MVFAVKIYIAQKFSSTTDGSSSCSCVHLYTNCRCVFPVCSHNGTFAYQKQKLLKIMQKGCWKSQFSVSRIFLVNWEFSFPKRLVRFSLPKQQYFGYFHDFKEIFMTSSTLFITKSTFSYQKAQKNKSCSKSCKAIYGRTNFVFCVYFW